MSTTSIETAKKKKDMRQIKVFTGSSHPKLTTLILERLGLPGSPAVLKRFSNAEISVEIGESVRDADVFIVQSGSDQVIICLNPGLYS